MIVTVEAAPTVDVSIRNVLLVEPAGIVTFAGTRATSGLPLDSAPTALPAGAAAVGVTVPSRFP